MDAIPQRFVTLFYPNKPSITRILESEKFCNAQSQFVTDQKKGIWYSQSSIFTKGTETASLTEAQHCTFQKI